MTEVVVKDQKTKILENLKTGKHTLIYGSHGIGKNYTVTSAAKQLGIALTIVNSADNFQEIKPYLLAAAISNSLVPSAFLFQDADNIEDWYFMDELVGSTSRPIFMTATNVPGKMSAKLKSKFEIIRFQEPRLSEVVAILKSQLSKDEQIDFHNVTLDIRQSLMNVRGMSESYKSESTIEELDELFINGKLHPNLEKHRWLWLLVYSNINRFYLPPDIVKAFEILQEAEFYNQPRLLTLLPRGKGKAAFPKNMWRR